MYTQKLTSLSLIVFLFLPAALSAQLNRIYSDGDEFIPRKVERIPSSLKNLKNEVKVRFKFRLEAWVPEEEMDEEEEAAFFKKAYGDFPTLYFRSGRWMNEFNLVENSMYTGTYEGPSKMSFYKLAGGAGSVNPMFTEFGSIDIKPDWYNVMVLFKMDKNGNVKTAAFDMTEESIPSGHLSLLNFTDYDMHLWFGEKGDAPHEVASGETALLSLDAVPSDYNTPVVVMMHNPAVNEWQTIYQSTWILQKTYRGAWVLTANTASENYSLLRRRLSIGRLRDIEPAKFASNGKDVDPDVEDEYDEDDYDEDDYDEDDYDEDD